VERSDAKMPTQGVTLVWDLGRPISRHLHCDTFGQVAQVEGRKKKSVYIGI
jgi:hypothetical protein